MCSKRALRGYLWLTAFCVLFAVGYQAFGHGVISLSMSTMFLWPLFLGVLPALLLSKSRGIRLAWWLLFAYRAGIATLIAGGAVIGIIEIYGTTSTLTPIYWYAGGTLALIGSVGALGAIAADAKKSVGDNLPK